MSNPHMNMGLDEFGEEKVVQEEKEHAPFLEVAKEKPVSRVG